MKIIVIGAGPTGCIAAASAAVEGHNVKIYEEHKRIGFPVRCGGLLSELAIEWLSTIGVKKNYTINKINKLIVHCGRKVVDISVKAFVISRPKFDQQCTELALKSGAKILTEKVSAGNLPNFDVLVGADGVNSFVASHFGFPRIAKAIAYQCIGSGNFEKRSASVFLFHKSFGYVIPENEEVARIGICFFEHQPKMFTSFRGLVKKLAKRYKELFCAQIPAEVRARVQIGNVFLVGDAAGAVKATSLGGIYFGCRSGWLAGKCIRGLDYEKRFRKEIFPMFRAHQIARAIMNTPFFPALFAACPSALAYDMEHITSLRPLRA